MIPTRILLLVLVLLVLLQTAVATTAPSTVSPQAGWLTGAINLNGQNVNAQIAGASVGVICGVTALIVCISITGVL